MGLRKFKRKVIHSQMEQAGVTQINKRRYPQVDMNGNATTVTRPSFYSMHWKTKGGQKNAED